jgi:hypothetical protein
MIAPCIHCGAEVAALQSQVSGLSCLHESDLDVIRNQRRRIDELESTIRVILSRDLVPSGVAIRLERILDGENLAQTSKGAGHGEA